jgi:hypothetical protein
MRDRVLSILAGSMILAAVAHVTTTYTGGYGTAHAWLTWTVAFGVLVASIFAGMAFSSGRRRGAWILLLCGLCSEAYNFLQTGDRLIAEIDRLEAPMREKIDAYAAAKKKVSDLEAVIMNPPETSKRLSDATTAKAKADGAVTSESAKPGCRSECSKLLNKAVEDAKAEVKAARDALDDSNKNAKTNLETAKKELAAMTPPGSASPLADTLGIPARLLSILMALCGSIGINGLAMALLVHGSHTHKEPAPRPIDRTYSMLARMVSTLFIRKPNKAAPQAPSAPARADNVVIMPATRQQPRLNSKPVVAYLAQHMPETDGELAEWGDVYKGYKVWGSQQDPPAPAYSGRDFGLILSAICEKADIRVLRRDGKVYCLNRKVRT